jgi:alpha-glucosidase (family GH31 glycosyl hydrolase)
VHSDPFNDRRPWSFGNATGNATDDPTEGIFRNFSHMRLQMLPMLATAAVHAASDGTPLVKRLDFAFPTEVDATRQDQYLFLDSMLVAPVNPFVNGSKPWTDGQTGVDPKTPGSFNRTREVRGDIATRLR